MSDEAAWRHLREQLAASEGTVSLWLRDDDATVPSSALDRLIRLTEPFLIPVTLAVIPALTGEALAQTLASHITPVIHGWAHINHATAPSKKQELGPERAMAEVERDLTAAIARMREIYGDCLVPMLVPPWNRIRADILPHLRDLGFDAVSAFGEAPARAPLAMINARIDLIDWRGTRGCRDPATLIEEVLAHLHNPAPVGLLAHHLVHDDGAWDFLERLFALTRSLPNVRWLSARDLLAAAIR